jgi:hypothetical protein
MNLTRLVVFYGGRRMKGASDRSVTAVKQEPGDRPPLLGRGQFRLHGVHET